MTTKHRISRNISQIYRLTRSYLDQELTRFGIGSGQQFFLRHIYVQPGITLSKLAEETRFDNATITRAIQKLEGIGYIRRESDERDGRVSHLFPTEKAEPIMDHVGEAWDRWSAVLVEKMTDEEAEQADLLLEKIAQNAYGYGER